MFGRFLSQIEGFERPQIAPRGAQGEADASPAQLLGRIPEPGLAGGRKVNVVIRRLRPVGGTVELTGEANDSGIVHARCLVHGGAAVDVGQCDHSEDGHRVLTEDRIRDYDAQVGLRVHAIAPHPPDSEAGNPGALLGHHAVLGLGEYGHSDYTRMDFVVPPDQRSLALG